MNQAGLDVIAIAGQRYGDIKVWALPLHGIAILQTIAARLVEFCNINLRFRTIASSRHST